MKSIFSTLFLIFALAYPSVAQTAPDSTQRHSLFVSTDALPILQSIFRNDGGRAYDLVLFREPELAPGQTGTRRRIGLSLGANYSSTETPSTSSNIRVNSLYVQGGISGGMERVRQLPFRVRVGMGPVLGTDFQVQNTTQNGTSQQPTHFRNWNIFGGLLGSAYWQATPWLMVGGESTLTANFFANSREEFISTGNRTTKGMGIGLNLQPLYRLSVCIRVR